MSRKVTYRMITFDDHGDVVRGVLQQEGGGHICYWHAPRDVAPKKGETHQLWMHADGAYFTLEGTTEIRAAGTGPHCIEVGHQLVPDGARYHGANMIALLAGLHRCHDADGYATWLEVS